MSHPPNPDLTATVVPRPPSASDFASRRSHAGQRRATPWDDDQVLVRHILGGCRVHFDMLYDAYYPRVYRFAFKSLRDTGDAEDITQEVFLTVFRALHTFQGESSLLVWILGITRNKVNRRFRRPRPPLESIEGDALEISAAQAATDHAVHVRRVLRRCQHAIEHVLTPGQRHIFYLKHLRHQPNREIAGSLGKSEDSIKTSLYRMRRSILAAVPELANLLSGTQPRRTLETSVGAAST